MTFTIDDSMTLSEIYGHALIVLREIGVSEEKGTAVCRCCLFGFESEFTNCREKLRQHISQGYKPCATT